MGARRMGALLLAAALATGLGACGGDDEDGGDGVSLEDIESSGSASATEEEAEEEDATGSDEDASATDETIDDELAEGFFGEGCGEFPEIFAAIGAAAVGGFGGDTEAFGDFEEAVEDAPDEVRDDLEVFSEAMEDYAAALADAGVDLEDPSSIDPNDPESFQVFIEAAEVLNTPEVQEASNNINAFIAAGCEG